MLKVKDIYAEARRINTSLFNIQGDTEWRNIYRSDFRKIDRLFNRYYSNFYLFGNDETVSEDALDWFKDDVSALIELHDYELETLYKTMYLNYNPIENYSMVENIRIEYEGGESSTNTRSGSQVNENVKSGSESTTNTKSGTETDTTTYSGTETDATTYTGTESATTTRTGSESAENEKSGTETDSTNYGADLQTTVNTISADDSADLVNDNQSAITRQAKIDSVTRGFNNRKDSETKTYNNVQDSYNKNFTNRQDSNVKSFANRQDSSVKSFNDFEDSTDTTYNDVTDTNTTTYNNVEDSTTKQFENRYDSTTHTRSGNIGVTTSQQMIESERVVSRFSFWDEFFKLIARELLIIKDEEEC